MNPIDVIANAIRVADGNHTMSAGQIAEVAAGALTDERIIHNAHIALLGSSTANGYGDRVLLEFAEIVLRSVGGA